MTDPLEELDVRVLTITLSPPDWQPVIDYEEDLDDLAAVQLLEIAWRKQRAELFESVGLIDVEMDDDD